MILQDWYSVIFNPFILNPILVFQVQSLYFLIQFPYFRFNPCIFSFNSLTLYSILVLSHSIPLLQIQSLYFLIQFPYFRFNPCISGSILVFHLLSFHFKIGMSVLSFGNFRTGKIPYSSVKVHLNFLTHGIAVVVKNYSTICGFAAHGGIIIHHACYAIHGEIQMYLS